MDICLLYGCCQVEVSATNRSPVRKSPTDWGVSSINLSKTLACVRLMRQEEEEEEEEEEEGGGEEEKEEGEE